jgi:hypothetical protein
MFWQLLFIYMDINNLRFVSIEFNLVKGNAKFSSVYLHMDSSYDYQHLGIEPKTLI